MAFTWLARLPAPSAPGEIEVNTFSIVAYDPERKEWGVAVASKYLAVGNAVPFARANVGAVATQAAVNVAHGPNGLDLLAKGKVAAFTGSGCTAYAGHKMGENYACQGNILAGEAVINDMAKAFEDSKGPLAWRMMAALEAADKAGGDKRGKQSAAILVVRDKFGPNGIGDRFLDLRVDDHKEPIPELARILSLRIKRPKAT